MFKKNTPKLYSLQAESTRTGLQSQNNIPFSPLAKKENILSPSFIDFNWLSSQPLLPFLTQILPTNLLYRSLLANGFEDSLEIIEWIRGDQLQKILDLDIWQKSFELDVEDVCVDRVFTWIQVWLAIDPEFAATRFLELEEETICLILSKLFEIIPEGITEISENVRENWWKTLDNRFYLRIRENENESFEILKQFVDSLYAHNTKLAGSLFAYACMLVRQETLEQGLRWRANRIADQGFITPAEARRILTPKKIIDLQSSVQQAKVLEAERQKAAKKFSSTLFAETESLAKIDFSSDEFDSIVRLISSFRAEDGAPYLKAALGEEKIKKLVGFSNVPVEQIYDDETFINEVAEDILCVVKNVILNLEFHFTNKQEANLIIEKSILEIGEKDKQKLFLIKESIAYLANCVNTVIEKNYNYNNIVRSILVVRGAINIGLELCLKAPEEYGLTLKYNNTIANAIDCINTLGVNFLFHLGWNLLFKVENSLAKKFIDIDLNHPTYKGKLKTLRLIKLSDNSMTEVSLDKLVLNLRFSDTLKWLESCESLFSNELFYTTKALFNRIPHLPKTLGRSSSVVSKETKAFETLEDIDTAFNFINNLNENLIHINE